jgi:hypothetical protein
VKTLPKEERPSRKRKKEEYNKKRRERSDEFYTQYTRINVFN